MRRTDLALAAALALSSALFPAASARPGVGALYNENVCRSLSDVPAAFDFETSFVGLASCAKLCNDAFHVCLRDVKDASSCQTALASDWIAFDSRLDCDGYTGALLRDCKAGWALDKTRWQQQIRGQTISANVTCFTSFQRCTNACSGT
jgi:hypothetical protein